MSSHVSEQVFRSVVVILLVCLLWVTSSVLDALQGKPVVSVSSQEGSQLNANEIIQIMKAREECVVRVKPISGMQVLTNTQINGLCPLPPIYTN